MSRTPSNPGVEPAPAEELSDVWMLLDELPRGSASAALAATTIEMAAVTSDADRAPRTGLRRWLAPAAVVAAALVAGLVAGRVTAPDPDRKLLELLPFVRHLDLLREAGSVSFLEAVAGRGGPPLRIVLRQGPAAARQDAGEFTAEIDSLGGLLRADVATRRAFVTDLPTEKQAELARSLRAFEELSAAERNTLADVAEALVDPARPEIQSAALDWHRWLTLVRPEERDKIVAAGADKRLDRIDWYAERIEGRGRPGQPDRPPPGRWPPGGEPQRGPEGRMRRPPPREGRDGPPPFRPDGPPPPPETRAPPG